MLQAQEAAAGRGLEVGGGSGGGTGRRAALLLLRALALWHGGCQSRVGGAGVAVVARGRKPGSCGAGRGGAGRYCVGGGRGGAPSPAGTGEPGLCGGRMLSGMIVPASSLWTVYAAAPFSGHEKKRNGTRGPPSQVGPPTPILPGSPQRQVCPALPGARLDPTQNRKC